jgi:hypothetical protein
MKRRRREGEGEGGDLKKAILSNGRGNGKMEGDRRI